MYDRWAGSLANPWAPQCDIYLHPTAGHYAKATGKPADGPGHSTVGSKGGRVVSRRIDLQGGRAVAEWTGVLPAEVTQVVLADLFADQPLPALGVVGMAALSEPPEGVARYRRSVPSLLREKKLFAVGPFVDQTGFPDAATVTAFYAESVSLVAYWSNSRGRRHSRTFLASPRDGGTLGPSRPITVSRTRPTCRTSGSSTCSAGSKVCGGRR